MQNMKTPDDLFSILLTRLGMKQNILLPGQGAQVDDLVAALRHYEWSVRVAAVQALGKMKGQVPIISLVLALLADEHEAVRAAAARKLGELGEEVPVASLVYALNDSSWTVRADAAYSLGRLGARVPIEPLVKAMHEDDDTTVRAAAVQALGEMGERAPVEALVSTLEDDQEWQVREAAVLALGKLGQRVPVAALVEAMHDEDEMVCEATRLTLQNRNPYGLPNTPLGPLSPSSQLVHEEAGQMPHAQMQANDTSVRDTTEPDTLVQNDERFKAIFLTLPLDHVNGHSSPETLRDSAKQTNEQNNNYRPLPHAAHIFPDAVSSERSPRASHFRSQASRKYLQPLILIGLGVLVVVALILFYIIGHLQ
jgi:HEAT repeat protein